VTASGRHRDPDPAAASRVIHVPGRTQGVRKLRGDGIEFVNGTGASGQSVPPYVTLDWLLRHRVWDRVDVLHLHHVDFESRTALRSALAECRRSGVGVAFTAHDVVPVFGTRSAQHRRLRELAAWGTPFICLTPATETDVRRRFPDALTAMIPHGYVAAPGTAARPPERSGGSTRFLVYGSLRPNRDIELLLACWRFSRVLRDSTMHLLLRAPSRRSLVEDATAWQAVRDHAVDPRLHVDVRPFPSDGELDAAMAAADCLILPYRWASHSGQLEHAFDLGVLPVAARTGYLPDQVALHDGRAPEPEWFEWPADRPYEHGARLLDALERAHRAIQGGWRAPDIRAFAAYRRREQADILAAHRSVYEACR
jgi:hypothetical protein